MAANLPGLIHGYIATTQYLGGMEHKETDQEEEGTAVCTRREKAQGRAISMW